MSKRSLARILRSAMVLVLLSLLAFLLGGVAIINLGFSPDMANAAPASQKAAPEAIFLVAAFLGCMGVLLDLVAWIGALMATAKQRKWGSFVAILLLNFLAILTYLHESDDVSVPQSQQRSW